jgi:hypothetical protein
LTQQSTCARAATASPLARRGVRPAALRLDAIDGWNGDRRDQLPNVGVEQVVRLLRLVRRRRAAADARDLGPPDGRRLAVPSADGPPAVQRRAVPVLLRGFRLGRLVGLRSALWRGSSDGGAQHHPPGASIGEAVPDAHADAQVHGLAV